MKHFLPAAFLSLALVKIACADSTVVFNEVMYHPDTTNETHLEWIELHNQMAVDMDLSGWTLEGDAQFQFPEGTVVAGGGYAVLASSRAHLEAAGGQNIVGTFVGSLGNGGGSLTLRNKNRRLMDVLDYETDGDWPVAPDGAGVSLAKRNEGLGTQNVTNWVSSGKVGGTPGRPNFGTLPGTNVSSTIVPMSASWRFDQSGTDFGTAWRELSFDDSTWIPGASLLAAEDCGCLPEPIRTSLSIGRTNYYFRTKFNYSGNPTQTALRIRSIIDDGAVAYLNGVQIWSIGMPEGTIGYTTPANRSIGDARLEGPFSVPASSLRSGVNVLAVEAHQSFVGSSDVVMGLSLEETRTEGGGGAQVDIPIAFNEIAAANTSDFWIELINHGPTNVALGGMVIRRVGGADREFILPPQTLAPGQFLWLGRTNLGFSADPGDKLVLYTPNRANVIDAALADRHTRARVPDGVGSFHVATEPTPAGTNRVVFRDEIVVNEIMYDHRPLPPKETAYTPTNFLVSITNQWRYHSEGVDLGTPWRQNAYNDTGWLTGRALFHATTASTLPAPKNTPLPLTAPSGARIVTWYFRTPFVFTGDLASAEVSLRTVLDDGAVFYLNGVEVYRHNMPGGTIGYNTLANVSVATATSFSGPFSIPAANLRVGTNLLAVEVHQFTTNALGADAVFGAELTATSLLAPAEPQRPSPESWVELHNRSTNTVSLAGWSLDGGIGFQFSSNQFLAPGGYLVVAKDPAYLRALYPSIEILGPFDKNLSRSSDRIIVRDPIGNVADDVRYYTDGHWPEFANGAGASLELRDPFADNAQAQAWSASDESTKTGWNTYSYRGVATQEPAASPNLWKEFVVGMLDAGEVLIDDISVIESPPNGPSLIQVGNFENGLGAWRALGNHKGTIIPDPVLPGNQVLRLVATGAMGHLHNHVETTLANNASIVNGREYEISFRAKWIAGNNGLHTRLYFNRLARVNELVIPELSGTPGSRNSTFTPNLGPTFTEFRHSPSVPKANAPVTITVRAEDADGVTNLLAWRSQNGGSWVSTPMALQANGIWSANFPGAAAGALVQFYVEGKDGHGKSATYPPAGRGSRALYRVDDGMAVPGRLHNIRILMTAADTTVLHSPTNVMSDELMGATVIYKEDEVFYDVGVHLQGSQRGRNNSGRVGFTLRFQPDHLFRGVHQLISIDRSGGYTGRGGRHDEIILKHAVNHAGGLPGMYDDLVNVIAPRPQESSTGLLLMAKYNKVFLEGQYENGNDGSAHKLELIYYPLTTADGTPQGYKLPNPDEVAGTDFRDLGNDKESYRWNFLKENQDARDDFSEVMKVAKALGKSGAEFEAAANRALNVSEWARAYAIESLFGVTDTYGFGLEHNFIVYIPPGGQRAEALLWDMDFSFYLPPTSGLIGNGNIGRLVTVPANQRLFYSHLYDLISHTYNTTYLGPWFAHYAGLLGESWGGALNYVAERSAHVLSQLPTSTPFTITSNGGNDFSVSSNLVTLTGTAPIQLEFIEVNGVAYPITWTSTIAWTLRVPVSTGVNTLALRGRDRASNVLSNLTDTIRVTTSATVPAPEGFVVINEIMYRSPVEHASFVELHNAHLTAAFDLSGWRLNGVDAVLPEGTILPAGGFLVVASDTNVYLANYPTAPLDVREYAGTLQNSGETIRLERPVSTNQFVTVDVVRYDNRAPWPPQADGAGPSLQVIDPLQDNRRVANWAAAVPTPGAANAVRAILTPFPSVWLNEVLVFNTTGVRDEFGEREPWIELFHAGSGTLSLNGYFLTDDLNDLTRWSFPSGSTLAPNGFRVVWADGQPSQNAGSNFHTNFRLTDDHGTVALVRTNLGRVEVIDYMHFSGLTSDRSYGSFPDGQPLEQQLFYFATPGASNNPAAPPLPVVINEWMADNAGPAGLRDPADGLFQDWFELYNPDPNAFDLSGHFLTDTLTQPTKFQIPAGTVIPGRGFLLVWADNQPSQNGAGDLHANFQLSAGGEAIGLFSPDGAVLSSVVFGAQTENVSQGFFPDGVTNLFYFMPDWTPRIANRLNDPAPTAISEIAIAPDGTLHFQVAGVPHRAYRVEYKDTLESPSWTPISTNRADNGVIAIQDATQQRSQRFYRAVLIQ